MNYQRCEYFTEDNPQFIHSISSTYKSPQKVTNDYAENRVKLLGRTPLTLISGNKTPRKELGLLNLLPVPFRHWMGLLTWVGGL